MFDLDAFHVTVDKSGNYPKRVKLNPVSCSTLGLVGIEYNLDANDSLGLCYDFKNSETTIQGTYGDDKFTYIEIRLETCDHT